MAKRATRKPKSSAKRAPPERIESDALGEVRVPKDALYGAQTARALHNFRITGRTAAPELIRAYLRLKRAAAVANQAAKAITPKQARLIQAAIDDLLARDESEWPAIFPVDPLQAGAGTSQNMGVNEVVANLANLQAGGKIGEYAHVHPNDHVNRSQSTNDSYPTAMRLALLDASRELPREIDRLARALDKKARAWRKLPKSGRTHLQDAVPMTAGEEFGGYARSVAQAVAWIERGRAAVALLGIGGSAVGNGVNVPRGYPARMVRELARLTGEKLRLSDNLVYSMQSQAAILEYSSMLRLYAIEMTRICNDLRLLASGPLTGLGEIKLPEVQPGSSIMPGKVNPSILEMANQAWYAVLGHDQTTAFCVQAGQLELNVMMPMMADAQLQATRLAVQATRTLRELCVEGIEPQAARMRRYFESTPQIATALTPRLGYRETAALVHEALEAGRPVLDLVRERRLLDEAELERLLGSIR